MIDRERGLEFRVSKVEDRSCSKGESKGLGLGEGVRADEFLMERGEFMMMLFLSFFFFFLPFGRDFVRKYFKFHCEY